MSTFAQRVSDLATRISTDTKALRTAINGNLLTGSVVDLTALTTATKTNLVAAINEIKAQANAIIDDTAANTSTTKTYSASKIVAVANAAAAQVKSDILGGASAAYDTLQEIQVFLQNEDMSIATIMTALGNRLRIDVNNQGLTAAQQQNGRTNLNAYGGVEIGNPDTDFVAVYNAGQS